MIKVIKGTIGYWDGLKIVPFTAASGAIELDSAAEAHFVESGAAEYVGEPEVDKAPAYNADMKADALREIGKAYGLTFKVGMSKLDMVAALDEYFNPAENGEDEDGKPDPAENGDHIADPDEMVEDDEEAPTFDSTEAVQ